MKPEKGCDMTGGKVATVGSFSEESGVSRAAGSVRSLFPLILRTKKFIPGEEQVMMLSSAPSTDSNPR